MPDPSFPRLSVLLPATAHPWLALAVTCSLWLLLLLFGAGLIVPGAPIWSAGAPQALSKLVPWQAALVLALVGFVSAFALSPEARARRLILPFLGVLALWAAALTVFQRVYALPETSLVIGLGLSGLALGLTVGTLSAAYVRRSGGARKAGDGPLTYLALGSALVLTLAPFAPDNPLTAPFGPIDPVTLVTYIPQQFYLLIKSTMLWVPLGFILAAGGLSDAPRRWVPAGVGAFFLVGWPFFDALRAGDLMEVLSAPIGVWVGLWLGESTRGAEGPADVRAPEPAPAPPPPERARAAGADRPSPPTAGSVPRADAGIPASALSGSAGEPTEPSPPLAAHPAPDETAAPTTDLAQQASPAFFLPRPHPLALIPALGLLALAAWGWWDFPSFQLSLGIALVLYVLLLTGFRHAWLVAIPALLPVLDLAPWTGRFFLDESDLFLLATLGAVLLHRPDPQAGPYLARPVAVLGGLFAVTSLIALLSGLLPLSPLDANAFAGYFSHYNALRVGKGLVWGLAFFVLLRWTVPRGSEIPARLFTIGVLLGLLGVILIGVRERWQFADLLDFSAAYRITASFSSMHTGGSHLPAFLALAVPFIWLWVVRRRDLVGLLAGPVLLAGAVYLVISTVTRASFLALAVEMVLLALFWLRGLSGRGARIALSALAFAAMAVVAGGVLYLGIQGSYFQQRMSMVERDTETRLDHWRRAVWMMDQDMGTRSFGMGLGTFPETYLYRNPLGQIPGNFRYGSEGSNGFLLLGAGETLYLAQRVPVQPETQYRLAFDLRGDAERLRLTIPVCEKHLLDSRDCVWNTYQVPGSGDWEHKEVTLNSGQIGRGGLLSRPPVELFLYNGEEKAQLVAVDNLSLRAPDGAELLRNGDFSAGGDFWFFKTHDHLAWHIKNLWVSLLFEQGWAGFIAFNLLILAVSIHLSGPAWRGAPVPAATMTAIVGFLTLGLFSSPFDAPRLTALFLAVLAVGLHAAPAIAVTASNRHPRLAKSRKRRRKSGRN